LWPKTLFAFFNFAEAFFQKFGGFDEVLNMENAPWSAVLKDGRVGVYAVQPNRLGARGNHSCGWHSEKQDAEENSHESQGDKPLRAEMKGQRSKHYVFSRDGGSTPVRDFHVAFDKAATAAKTTTGSGPSGKRHFRDLRRSAITRMGARMIDQRVNAGRRTRNARCLLTIQDFE
jgi:hypothetical protein